MYRHDPRTPILMPRRARLKVPGVPWHIIQRGNNRSACFHAESDYRRYLDELTLLSERFECAVHAYVLMTNHVHLLLTPRSTDGPALLMKHLGQRYVQYFNRAYGRSGTLWEGRFRSCLAQSERYVLACYRYIELNPVRAGMVPHPGDYRWSSYRANAEGIEQGFLVPNDQYLGLGLDDRTRRAAYMALFGAHVDDQMLGDIRQATNGNFALGKEEFQARISAMLKRRVTPGRAGRPQRSGAAVRVMKR